MTKTMGKAISVLMLAGILASCGIDQPESTSERNQSKRY
jgi:hypothetical protein